MSLFAKKIKGIIFALGIVSTSSVIAEAVDYSLFSATKLRTSDVINFDDAFSGKVLLVVNTASQCGFTPQFKGLEALYQKYKDQGLEIVGFPSADFNQEFKDSEKTASICYENYGVTFTMMEESSIRGDSANDFYTWLIAQDGKAPTWNFNKYLLDSRGNYVEYFGSASEPLGGDLEKHIQKLLVKS